MTVMVGSTMGLFGIWPMLVVIWLVLLGYLAYRLAQGRRTGTHPTEPSSGRRILDQLVVTCGHCRRGVADCRRRAYACVRVGAARGDRREHDGGFQCPCRAQRAVAQASQVAVVPRNSPRGAMAICLARQHPDRRQPGSAWVSGVDGAKGGRRSLVSTAAAAIGIGCIDAVRQVIDTAGLATVPAR